MGARSMHTLELGWLVGHTDQGGPALARTHDRGFTWTAQTDQIDGSVAGLSLTAVQVNATSRALTVGLNSTVGWEEYDRVERRAISAAVVLILDWPAGACDGSGVRGG
jgi:hypothetical protein